MQAIFKKIRSFDNFLVFLTILCYPWFSRSRRWNRLPE